MDPAPILVGEHDFTLDGEVFTSISALAKKASGSKSINGYLWAGLVKRPARTAKAEKAAPATTAEAK